MVDEAAQIQNEFLLHHEFAELVNVDKAHTIVHEWSAAKDWPSATAVRGIHQALLEDIPSYGRKGVTPIPPGEYRKSDIYLANEREGRTGMYVKGTDIAPTMEKFSKDLDRIISELPDAPAGNLDTIVHDAAWVYYVFERIHPFLDGNGRTGRLIMERITRGSGLPEIIFSDREAHLDAMTDVDYTGYLTSLEVYILENLRNMQLYSQTDAAKSLVKEIDLLITAKRIEMKTHREKGRLAEVWSGFEDLDYLWQPLKRYRLELEKTPTEAVAG